MKVRVALIGCGAVGAVHATQLAGQPEVELAAVYNPRMDEGRLFAERFRVPVVAGSVKEAAAAADAVIICSPSPSHFEQAQACLRSGRHTLVELPPCGTLEEAEELGRLAKTHGALLGCAHTSRFLAPYARIREALQFDVLGPIEEISYMRHPQLHARSWTDDALLHHAAHVIDLVLDWCGGLVPLACAVYPAVSGAQSVSLIGAIPGGKALTATISYGGRLPFSRMIVVAANHTVETDGFSYQKSDLAQLDFVGDESSVYEQAIAEQDAMFLNACQGIASYIPWVETENLMSSIGGFKRLAATRGDISRLDRS